MNQLMRCEQFAMFEWIELKEPPSPPDRHLPGQPMLVSQTIRLTLVFPK
jgi:hypothetical protein